MGAYLTTGYLPWHMCVDFGRYGTQDSEGIPSVHISRSYRVIHHAPVWTLAAIALLRRIVPLFRPFSPYLLVS